MPKETDAEDLKTRGASGRRQARRSPVLQGFTCENNRRVFGIWWRRQAMKLIRFSSIVAAALAMAFIGASPAVAAPGDGIAGTAHDFTTEINNTEAIGLCTFCHTPHRAQSTRLLWNHTLSAETYSWSDITSTTGGTPLPTFDSTWQGVSKNCLSCHDGTVAIGDVAWFQAAPKTGVNAILDHQHDDPADPALITFNSGLGGGGDMSGNHPVAHPFPYQGQASTYNGSTTGASALQSGWVADPTAGGIRLFNDAGGEVTAGAVAGSSGIECSSCHDPHNGNGVVDVRFLRGTITGNDQNYICLKCHAK
jgi:hypothetical protein